MRHQRGHARPSPAEIDGGVLAGVKVAELCLDQA